MGYRQDNNTSSGGNLARSRGEGEGANGDHGCWTWRAPRERALGSPIARSGVEVAKSCVRLVCLAQLGLGEVASYWDVERGCWARSEDMFPIFLVHD